MSGQESKDTDLLRPDKWVEMYGDYLYTFAFLRLKRSDVAEDLVQDTFLSAWNAREAFQNKASEKTWLTSILRNKIIDYFRKSSTKNELIRQKDDIDGMDYFFETAGDGAGHWKGTTAPAEWKKDLNNPVEAEEFRNILQACLDKLSEKAREVFVLKMMDDLETEEVCKALDITASNYWVLIHRAKMQLRVCIEKNWSNS